MAKRRQGIRAGQAFVEMTANDQGVQTALKKMKRDFQGFRFRVPILSQFGAILKAPTMIANKFRNAFARLQKDLAFPGEQIRRLARDLDRFGQTITSFGLRVKLFGVAFAAGMLATIGPAARVESSFTRQRLLLGEAAAEAEAYVQNLARATNRTGLFVRESLNSFQAFFQGLDFGTEAAEDFARGMTRLQLDFAAAAGQTAGESMRRFIAALAGSPEVLDQFGIDLKELSLNAVLAAHGIDGVRKATEQQKTLARMLLIFDRLGKQGAIDAATKTMTNFATILDRMKGEAIEIAAELGMSLKPAFIEISKIINGVGGAIKHFISTNKDLTKNLLISSGVITGVGVALTGLGIAIRAFAFGLQGLALIFFLPRTLLSVVGFVARLGLLLPTLLGPIGAMAAAIGLGIVAWKNWAAVTTEAKRTAMNAVSSMRKLFRDGAASIVQAWAAASDFVIGAVRAMSLAVTGGKPELAFEILSKTIEIAWMTVSNRVRDIMDDLSVYITSVLTDLRQTLADMWDESRLRRWLQYWREIAKEINIALSVHDSGAEQLAGIGIGETEGVPEDQLRREREVAKFGRVLSEQDRQSIENVRKLGQLQEKLRKEREREATANEQYARNQERIAEANARREREAELLSELGELQRAAGELPQPLLDSLKQFHDFTKEALVDSVDEAAGALGDALGVQGGFADRILTGLTGNRVQQKIAENTEQTAKNTAESNKQLSRLAGTFGS